MRWFGMVKRVCTTRRDSLKCSCEFRVFWSHHENNGRNEQKFNKCDIQHSRISKRITTNFQTTDEISFKRFFLFHAYGILSYLNVTELWNKNCDIINARKQKSKLLHFFLIYNFFLKVLLFICRLECLKL